jgi:UPF0176 protein
MNQPAVTDRSPGYLLEVGEPKTWSITSFYRFLPLTDERVADLREAIEARMQQDQLLGLIIVSPEGVNGTLAGGHHEIESFETYLVEQLHGEELRFKRSVSAEAPFHRVSVVIRQEIVGLKRPDLVPESPEDRHLSPAEWHAWLASDRPRTVIDTRNRYETRIGKFSEAVDPDLSNFSSWAEYAESGAVPKDVPVLIYCTGGIRCEKVLLDLRQRGYHDVYQLRDGILGYLAEYPNGFYEGECYVFDDRVAVDQNLQPTQRYATCPGCGLPADAARTCGRCGDSYVVCPDCEANWGPVCSKPCRDLYLRHGLPAAQTA